MLGRDYYVFTVFCYPDVPMPSILSGLQLNSGDVVTATNRWTGYILSEVVPKTWEQDMTEYLNWRQTGAGT